MHLGLPAAHCVLKMQSTVSLPQGHSHLSKVYVQQGTMSLALGRGILISGSQYTLIYLQGLGRGGSIEGQDSVLPQPDPTDQAEDICVLDPRTVPCPIMMLN